MEEKLFDDLTGNENLQEWIQRKVVEEYFDLSTLHGAVSDTFLKELTDSTEGYNSFEAREKTLSYLLPLLQQGKLKVKVINWVKRFPNEEEKKKILPDQIGKELDFPEVIIECPPAQPEAIVAEIRERWNTVSEKDRSSFEEWSVLFTLPENEWAM